MSMSEFSRLERMSLLSSYFIISSLEFTWCIGKLMKLLPFCFWMWTSANMSVKLRMNGSLLSLEDITIPSVNTLRIYLETNDHVFEGRVLQLLAKCAGIRELNLSFQSRDEHVLFPFQVQGSCLPHCICHGKHGLWEAEVVQMGALEEVEIVNYHGTSGETYFVEQLVKRAPALKHLRVTSKVENHFLDEIGKFCPPKCTVQIVVALE